VRGYWKRFVGLVTDSAHKYSFDPFFRTEINVVLLQLAFSLFLLAVVGVIATQLYHDASAAVTQGINDTLAPNSTPASIGNAVISELSAMRSRTVAFAAGVVILVTVLFTYIITRLALSPTRNALESQKQFIGNVAHEIRTPLAVTKTNIEVALMSPVIEQSLKKSLTSTVEELDRISEIINNLLSLSASIRPERIEFNDVDFGRVVDNVMQKLRKLAEPKLLELEVRMSERRVVWGNTTALEQIVMNVVKNAISHTPRNGRILLTIEPVYPDFMEFTVQDSGSGIARKDLFRIFEPYYRADPSRKRGDGGSGLGLTIVSELVKLHNGKITVRSAEGRGTTVSVLLPAGKMGIGTELAQKREEDSTSEIAVDFSHNGRRGS
jgi:signal transduction histidine kinase